MRMSLAVASLALVINAAVAADATRPIADSSVVFSEKKGLVAVEAEHFSKQDLTDRRAFHICSSLSAPTIEPDGDGLHVGGAAGGAYVEVLPDSRRNHSEKLIGGENFSNDGGKLAVLTYKVHFENPGRYYVWVRAFSSGSEDNGLHVGIDGAWPESGRRMQWCEGKKTWRWESKQRTESEHCGEPHKIFLDVNTTGVHEVHFSMREDGFEFDRWLMTTNRDFERPEGIGPEVLVHAGKLPNSFPYVEPAPAKTPEPQPDAVANAKVGLLQITAKDFSLDGSGYYLDKGKWLAVNPNKDKAGKVQTTIGLPSGRYNLRLVAVGEEDGKSTYQVAINDVRIGEFTCPLSAEQFEESSKSCITWSNIAIEPGDVLTIASQIASEDGKEFSRARFSRLEFTAADEATKAAIAQLAITSNQAGESKPADAPLVLPRQAGGNAAVKIEGELKQWHKVTLTLDGPYAHELDNAPNPFVNYEMNVEFKHESGSPSYTVPGYFAADGQAAETSAQSGTKWRAHLSPDKPGRWEYKVSMRKGTLIVETDSPSSVPTIGDGKSGSFTIAASDKTGRDLRAHGRLQYVGERYLKFAGSGQTFLKAGADAPETMLGYADFDGTVAGKPEKVPLKTWGPHVGDWKSGDPTWKNGKGKGLIGAINYLSSKGCNAFSFLTYNAGGDGDNVWPFVQRDDKLHYDCSKLDQWGIVFDHGTARGMYLHFKMQETENDDNRAGSALENNGVPECLDDGDLGPQRRLYCRELIARFGHNLALNWNLGEENTQTTAQQMAMIDFIAQLDPYHHNRVVHTFPNEQDKVYRPLLGNASKLTGQSLQNGAIHDTHWQVAKWVRESQAAGKPWVVAFDESGTAAHGQCPDLGYQGFDGHDRTGEMIYTEHEVRRQTLWGTLMGGGAGVEYYFGYQFAENDLVCEDWRSRDRSWDYCRIALDFFSENKIPINALQPADELVGTDGRDNSSYCFAKSGDLYLVYTTGGPIPQLDLAGASGNFSVHWFNPRTGGELVRGSIRSVAGGGRVSLGAPPSDQAEDWLIVIRR